MESSENGSSNESTYLILCKAPTFWIVDEPDIVSPGVFIETPCHTCSDPKKAQRTPIVRITCVMLHNHAEIIHSEESKSLSVAEITLTITSRRSNSSAPDALHL